MIVCCTYLFEGYLTYYYKSGGQLTKKIRLYKKKTGKKYDLRSTAELYEKIREESDKVSLDVKSRVHFNNNKKIIPLSGASYAKTIHCNDRGYYSIYDSDRYGFNNPDKEWDKAKHEFLLVGDGFIHNNCVNNPNGIVSVLRSLTKKSVLNLGYNGNGPLSELATLKEYLKPNVKNILWVYHEGSDIEDLEFELNSPILKKYLKNFSFSQNLINKQPQIDKIIFEEIDRVKKDYFFHEQKSKTKHQILKFIRLNQTKNFLKNYLNRKKKNEIRISPKFKIILTQANILAKKNNSDLYLVYLPELNRYKKNYNNVSYDYIKKVVDELNIPLIDMHVEVFLKEKNPLSLYPFQMVEHYTIEGYEKVAKSIYKFFNNQN